MDQASPYIPASPAPEDALVACLSRPRLQSYLKRTDGDPPRALRFYEWNTELSAALYVPIQIFEVAVRNAVVKAVVEAYTETWYRDPRFYGRTKDLTDYVQQACAKADENKGGFPFTGDDVVAASTMGLAAYRRNAAASRHSEMNPYLEVRSGDQAWRWQ